jgi:hypothetical protein
MKTDRPRKRRTAIRNTYVAFIAWVAASAAGPAFVLGADRSAIPTLDQMAGDWCRAENVLNPPAINNRRDLIQVRSDLISTRFNPGGTMMPQTATAVPLPALRIDGREYPAQAMRWSAYEARRRNPDCDGLHLETAVRLMHEDQGFLTRIAIENPSDQTRSIRLELEIPDGTTWATESSVAFNRTLRRGTVSVFVPVQKPDQCLTENNGVVWRWQLSLSPGASRALEYVVACDQGDEAVVIAKSLRWAQNFPKFFQECKQQWEQRWAEVFAPNGSHFSGHLPVLETPDEAMRRIYYMSVLTVLGCERSQYKVSPRDFLTETDRPGKQYFWDASMMAGAWALLEPEGMKASLRLWLACDLLNSHGFNIGNGTDMKPGWYAFSGANVFYTALTYAKTTGDHAFLDERLPLLGQSVLQRLDAIAMLWKQRVAPDQPLVNWSNGGGILLESGAPTYRGCVASLNAQSVGMMREMAQLHDGRGNAARAQQLRDEAEKLLPAVLGLYKPGEGVWESILADGTRAEQRHCVDFIYVTQAIAPDLTQPMRREMLDFVRRELVMKNWLRAMSLKDPGARKSVRPDHGPMGAFDGWVPLVVAEMCRLGDWAEAVDFLRRTELTTHEGPYAQAHEFFGPQRMAADASICVATGPTIPPFEEWRPSRGEKSGAFSSKECIAGGAFADAIIGTLFGFRPDWNGAMLAYPSVPRPFEGRLQNLKYLGKLYDVKAGKGGVTIEVTGNSSN